MISKRTKVFAVLFALCAIFVLAAEYKDFRRFQQLRAQYRGREYALQLLDEPYMPPLVKGAVLIGTISLVVAFTSVVIDLRHFWHRSQR